MKKMKLMLVGVCLVYQPLFAGKASEGGVKQCLEFANMAGEIAEELVNIGQDKMNEYSSLVDVRYFWKQKVRSHCTPVLELDRTARSNPDTGEVLLLVNEQSEYSHWDSLNKMEKYRIAAHELSILAKYEKDGEYFVSTKIMSALKKFSGGIFKFIDLTGEGVLVSPDKSQVTVYLPFLVLEGEKVFISGGEYLKYYCSLYGLVTQTYSRDKFSGADKIVAFTPVPTSFTVHGLLETEIYMRLLSISCKIPKKKHQFVIL